MQSFHQIAIHAAEKLLALGALVSTAILDDGNQAAGMDCPDSPLAGCTDSHRLWLQLSKHHLPSFITNYIHLTGQAHAEMLQLAGKQMQISQQILANSLARALPHTGKPSSDDVFGNPNTKTDAIRITEQPR